MRRMTAPRRIVAAALLTVAVCSVGLYGGTPARAADVVTLNLYIGGDTNIFDLWKKAFLPAFTKRYPRYKANMVELLHDQGSQGIYDKILAAKRTARTVDVDLWETEPGFMDQGIAEGLWVKLSEKVVPNVGKVPARTLEAADYYGLPYRGSSVVIGYNSQFVKNAPQTFDEVVAWIKANPGKFTYCDPNTCGSGTAFVTAAIYRYTGADKFAGKAYDAKEETAWAPGWKLLKELQPAMYNNGFHPNGNVSVLQLIAQQNVYMASVWSDMGLDWAKRGQLPKTMRFVQITPPLMGDDSRVMVPAGSAHLEGALTLLNWLLTPEAQTMVIDEVAGYPGIDWKYMPESVRQKFQDLAKAYAPWPNPKYLADIRRLWHEQVVGGAK
jgi:putative spermidine/putrescine transport system substrate-binding protein